MCFTYFLHDLQYLLLCGNINRSCSCEVYIHLHMAMTAGFVIVVNFNSLNKPIDQLTVKAMHLLTPYVIIIMR